MKTVQYKVNLTGSYPLLMHADNVAGAELVKAWQKNPKNKEFSVAGDDRSPAWTWLNCLYHNAHNLVIDVDLIMACLREAGKKCPNPNGKGSLKSQTQSGIIAEGLGWNLYVNGKTIPWEPLNALYKENDFEKHQEIAESMGINLFIKRAKIGFNKHVRVRPRFENWSCNGIITVLDPMLTKDVIQKIFDEAGFYCGFGDWRPNSRSPGQFGRFDASIQLA